VQIASVPEPIARLCGTCEILPPTLHGEILALGPAAVGPLIELLRDEAAGSTASPGEGWPPIHAVDLLVDLKAQSAILPLLETLVSAELDEVIHSRIVIRLPELGAAVLEPLLRLMHQQSKPHARDALCTVMSELGVRDERIFDCLCEYFDAEPGLGARCFADYGDARALPFLAVAIETFEPDWDSAVGICDLDELVDAYEQLDGSLPPRLIQHVNALRAKWSERDAG
jgi:hypothetical protein